MKQKKIKTEVRGENEGRNKSEDEGNGIKGCVYERVLLFYG